MTPRKPNPVARDAWAAALSLLLLAVPAGALTPVTLVGPDLQPRAVRLQSLLDGNVSFFDVDRRLQTTAISDFLQIRLAAGRPDNRPQGELTFEQPGAMLVLTDGQRLVGRWAGADATGQIIHWEHPQLGLVQVSLDDVRAVALDDPALAQRDHDRAQDHIVLSNGDTLDGYVVEFGSDALVLAPERGERLTLPLDRIAAVQLAAPLQSLRAASGEHLLWLTDGSRVLASSVQIAGDELAMTPTLRQTGQPVSLPIDMLVRLDVSPGSPDAPGRLASLLDQPMSVTAGGEVFGLAMPPRVEGDALYLHAPVTVRFELPRGAARLAARAELDEPASYERARRGWANFDVIVRIDGVEVARATITARRPDATINVPAEGLEATIEVDEGANGPVMDRLRLVEPILLIR